MKNKTIVITGANAGIGFEAAKALAAMGARVVMICRDETRGTAAQQRITAAGGTADLLICDFSDLGAVGKIAARLQETYPVIDVLLNNAGAINGSRLLSKDGYELSFAINHLAPFLLTLTLLPHLGKNKCRIINTASMAHFMGHINFDDIQSKQKYGEMSAYAQSKLANILFTYSLARRLKGSQVTVNCLHPGVVRSNFASGGSIFSRLFYIAAGPIMINAAKGSRTSVFLCSSADVEGISGAYFSKCKAVKSSKESYDTAVQEKLWDLSLHLTGISNPV